jgi:hypothetical protein
MSTPISNRPSGPFVAQPKPEAAAGEVESKSAIEQALEANETVGKVEDSVWTAAGALDVAAKLGKTAKPEEMRLAGAAAGALIEATHPGPEAAGHAVEAVGEAIGEHGSGFTESLEHFMEHTVTGKALDGALKGAAVVDFAVNGYKDLNDDTFKTTGGKVANALADAGVSALGFAEGPVGWAVMGTELVTGGGVSGSAKGMVAMGEGMWTGDDSAEKKWTDGAKAGEYGWAVKAVANNETASAVAGAASSVVVGTAVAVAKPVVEGVEALANTRAGQAVIGEVKREAGAVGDAAVALANTKAGKAVIGEAKVAGQLAVKVGGEIADKAVEFAHSKTGQEIARDAKAVGHAAVVTGKAVADTVVAAANTKAGKEVIADAKAVGHVVAEGASKLASSTVGKMVSSGAGSFAKSVRDDANAVTAAMKKLPKAEDALIASASKGVSNAWHALTSW